MGRWAQARKRGSTSPGATQSFPCPAPTDDDWGWEIISDKVNAFWSFSLSGPCYECTWELWIAPSIDGIYTFVSNDDIHNPLDTNLTTGEEFWGKVRLSSCDDPPVPTSDFSPPQHLTPL